MIGLVLCTSPTSPNLATIYSANLGKGGTKMAANLAAVYFPIGGGEVETKKRWRVFGVKSGHFWDTSPNLAASIG
jgi:hypothetical protein